MTEADKLIEEILGGTYEDGEGTPSTTTEPPKEEPEKATPPVEDQTKAFSERLKKEKEKLKSELARELGYESWEKAAEARATDTMLNKGLDPEKVKPIIKDLLKTDPDYIAAIEYKKEKEELEKNIWAENELKKLNTKFNLGIKSVNDLDSETIKLWNSGLSLDKAYAAEHYAELEKKFKEKSQTGKEHMVPTPGSGTSGTSSKVPTAEQIKMFKKLIPGIRDEDITKYLNKK